jgi:hexosaminidase
MTLTLPCPRRAARAAFGLSLLLAIASAHAHAQAPNAIADRYPIVPRPAHLEAREGEFVLHPRTTIVVSASDSMLGHRLARELAPATGYALRVVVGDAPAQDSSLSRLVLQRDPTRASLGTEGYTLTVSAHEVRIRAGDAPGLFYGVQSLRQLLPPTIFRAAAQPAVRWTVPAVHIEDTPRFSWRGAHLDVARHFMPVDFVKRWVDLLAMHKLNRFHWHLTDDQGWRIAIAKYPRLTEVGGCRARTLIGAFTTSEATRRYDESRHCGFYTQDDIREVVQYAAERHITVVPEIEMPGHAQAALAAYPQLGVYPDSVITPMQVWGVSDFILNVDESTIAFMHDVLTEVLALFPGPFIHVGGDEAKKAQWTASPRVQARMRELGVADEHALQSWFIGRMDAFLTERGRRLIGWDEILEGGLAPNATVMSWRGTAGAREGHDVVMAPTSHTYFDYYQSRDHDVEPRAFGGFLPLDTVYAYEPVPSELTPEQARHVLGAQAQHWTEYMRTPRHVEYMAFPRLAALAEVVWTPAARKDFADFRRRLDTHMARLSALGVNARPLDPDGAQRPAR